MIMKITRIPAEPVHVDPAIHYDVNFSLFARARFDCCAEGPVFQAALGNQRIGAGQQRHFESAFDDEVFLVPARVANGAIGRPQLAVAVVEVEPRGLDGFDGELEVALLGGSFGQREGCKGDGNDCFA